MIKKLFNAVMLCCLIVLSGCGLNSEADAYLGDPYTSTSGGYILRPIKDFTFRETGGVIQMVAPDGDTDKGPAILVVGGISDEAYTDETLMAKFLDESSEMIFDSTKKYTVDGINGILAQISSTNYIYEMAGRAFLANPYPYQPFVLIGFAIENAWQDFKPLVDAVIQSVEFFEAQAITP